MRSKLVHISTLLTCFLLPVNNLVAQAPPEPVSAETLSQWMTDLSNWGRWGDDDQLGTLNLITPEKRRSAAGLKVEAGDVLLIHTGRLTREATVGPWNATLHAAGLHASTVQWLKVRDVAVLGSDGASDVLPSGVEGQTHPVHQLVIIALGMPILDDLDLTALAEETARQNRWTFLFTAAPLRVVGGTGSPLNPIATF
jgi:kynurenine formamidase